MELMRRRRGIMGLNGGAGIPIIIATATGNPLTFETDLAKPLKSLVIPFTPIQPEIGDPISGWDGCNIVNMMDGVQAPLENRKSQDFNMTEDGLYTQKNKYSNPSAWSYNYRVTEVTVDAGSYLFWFDAETITTNAEIAAEFRLYSSANELLGATSGYNKKYGVIQLTVDSQTTVGLCIKNYNGAWRLYYERLDSTIVFTDPATGDPLTVYGATVTLNEDGSADLVVTWVAGTLNGSRDLAWGPSYGEMENSSAVIFYHSHFPVQKVDNATDIPPIVCETLPVVSTSTFTTVDADEMSCSTVSGVFGITLRLTAFKGMTTSQARTYLNEHPVNIVYLTDSTSAQTHYHYDNVGQLITSIGENAIWTDTNGMNTATYLKHQS